MNLEVKIGSLGLKTPMIGSSGLFGYGDQYGGLLDLSCFGAVVAKTVTPSPRDGNPPPRLADCGAGLLNSIGLENVGSAAFLGEKLPALKVPCRIFASIGGDSVADYGRLAGLIDGAGGVDAIEVNISCPNVERGGLAFGVDAASARRVIESVRGSTRLAVIAKLPPVLAGIEDVARAACDGGADALTVANTYPAMAIDLETERPVLGAVSGGYSGRAVMPVSLLLVWKAAGCVGVPIIASGGIERPEDALQYMLAGASAFQVGSVVLRDLEAPARIIAGIEAYLKRKGYKSVDDLRGRARAEGI